ncbi:MAG: penicillin-binding protein 2 [Armatimonadetes bacterium]|nr:penicillin-binding protein 2 [Armatimonadota bacterium]
MEHDSLKYLSARLLGLRALLLAMFVVLGVRLWQLQILQGDYYDQLSESNRIRVHHTAAPRGVVLDRRAEVLVSNRPSFTIAVLPMELRDPASVLPVLSSVLGVPLSEIQRRLKAGRARPFEPVPIRRDVGIDVVTALEERRSQLAGVIVVAEPVRQYRYGPLAAHVLGYLGEIDAAELHALRDRGYRSGDLIGKSGVERQYDNLLRGEDGDQVVEVDAGGRPLRVLRESRGHTGRGVVLSLDRAVQQAAEEALQGRTGAVVAMQPRTGEILAMASSPAFDPNLFAAGISAKNWGRLARDPRDVMINRAAAAAYEPGSVFKIVTGAAALHEGVSTPQSRLLCTGSLSLGPWVFRDLAAHGTIDFTTGVAQSCNVMFWQLGRAIGPDRLYVHAKAFGLGDRTGVDLPLEVSGSIPTTEYKRRHWKEPWYPGDTLNMSIGQGFVLTTPLQIARMVSAVANGGELLRPRLVRGLMAPGGTMSYGFSREVQARVKASPAHLAAIRAGMAAVVSRGTGRAAAIPGLSVAGKTGSAETPRGRPHAWFAGFAPVEDPQIVVVVLVEHGYRGGLTSSPIARRVIEAWRARQAPPIGDVTDSPNGVVVSPAVPAGGVDRR